LNPLLPTFFDGAFSLTTVNLPTNNIFGALGIERGVLKVAGTIATTEIYGRANLTNGLILPKVNDWMRWSYFIYSPDVEIVATPGRLRTLWIGGTQFDSASATMKKIDTGLYLVTGKGQFTGNLTDKTTVWFENVLTKVAGGNFANQNIYVTGFTLAYSLNENFALKDSMLYAYKELFQKQIFDIQTSFNNYNNLPFNVSRVSEFLRKYEMKEVDAFNQLTILMVGDSIFGRQTNAEMTLTQDTNGGVGNGYETGHYPPNMWNENVAFKLLQSLQYRDADVKYYNHVASEVTKVGTWTTNIVEPDKVRVAYTNQLDANAILTFTGAAFCKAIFSSYYASGIGASYPFQMRVSIDNGVTYVTPESLGLTTSLAPSLGVNGNYATGTQFHKWFNIIIGGLNPITNYKIKFNNRFASGLAFWGFETWSKPRINMIVTAEGGNTAANQLTRWERFYSIFYNPSLIIYELPYLNDLGTGIIANFKGTATTATTPSASPSTNDFWYASVDGTYTNFSGVTALAGQYIEWSGSAWRVGQTSLNAALANYNTNNNTVFQRLATLGIPVLTLITHNGNTFYTRPFTYQNGLTILRNLIAKYGFASIDVNNYQNANGLQSSILSDGTHLNNSGVQMYSNLINAVLDIDYTKRYVGTATEFQNKKLIGSGTGASTITFGYEFSKIPTVRIYGNTSIVITAKTQSSFTVTGSGAFDYEVFIQ